ncbi:MAG: hypothetical protein KME64_28275 [Scytonematopsis contorta HA4267-MV1]|jgi:hypothetical protein|nr:hypothetical protein [Scytonematopsis contorta HA4267-MV1]
MSSQVNNQQTNIAELSEEDLSVVNGGCHHHYKKPNCKPYYNPCCSPKPKHPKYNCH